MKHLKIYGDYIIESVKSIDYIYKTYYPFIKRARFDKIISLDPTTKTNKLGAYCKWLIKIYEAGYLIEEDYYKASEYLKLYDRFKHTLPIGQRNIDNINSLPELAEIIEPFEEPSPELLSSEENKKLAYVTSFEECDLYIPYTYEQSRDLGRGTKWCTAADSKEGRETFKKYEAKGSLYILISKLNPKEKFQFHFEERMFMDTRDQPISLVLFLKLHPDVRKYFKHDIEKMSSFLDFKNYEKYKKEDYPDIIYYGKDDYVAMEYNKKKKILYVDFKKIWKTVEILYEDILNPTNDTKTRNILRDLFKDITSDDYKIIWRPTFISQPYMIKAFRLEDSTPWFPTKNKIPVKD